MNTSTVIILSQKNIIKMKNLVSFLAILFLCLSNNLFSQTNNSIEIYGASNFTNLTNRVSSQKGKLGYNFGIAITGAMSNEKMHWVGGLQMSSYGDKYESGELRWPTQHDGEGGFDENIESGEDVEHIKFKSTYFYLESPIGVRYYVSNTKLKIFLQPTINPSLFMTNRSDATYEYYDGSSTVKSSSYGISNARTINLNGAFGIGVEVPLSEKVNLLIQPQGSMQIFSAGKNSETGSRLYNYGLKAGIQFGI